MRSDGHRKARSRTAARTAGRARWPALLALLIALAAPLAWSAPAPRELFETYDRAQGLGNPNVFGLLEDRDGFLWVATQRGLYRFEGTRFRHYVDPEGLSEQGGDSNLMGSLLQDRSGRIWAATQTGLYVVEGTALAPVLRDGRRFDLNAVSSALAEQADGSVLAVSDGQLLRIRAAGAGWQVEPYAPADPERRLDPKTPVRSVYADPQGRTWFGCGDALCESAGGALRVWNAAAGLPAGEWYRLVADRAGTLWAMSLDRIAALPPGGARFEDRTPDAPLLAGSHIFVLAEDAQGRMRTSIAGGLAVWDAGRWSLLGSERGIPEPPVLAMLDMRDGSSWYGVAGAGLMRRLGDERWQHLLPADGLQNGVIWAIADDAQGRSWIATHTGVDVYDPRSGRVAPWAEGRRLGIGSLQWLRRDPRGRLWMASNDGAIVLHDPASGLTRRGSTQGGSFNDLTVDPEGRVWIGGRSGLYRVANPDAPAGEPLRLDLVLAPTEGGVRAILSDGGARLVATTGRHLYVFENGAWRPGRFAIADDQPMMGYSEMSRDGAIWWVDSQRGGLMRLDGPDASTPQLHAFAPLTRDTATFLRRDAQDRLWIGTDNGVLVYEHGRWTRLAHGEGLVWNDTDSGAFYAGDDDSVAIGTSNGLTRIRDVGAVLAAAPAPRAGIVQALWNGAPLSPDGAAPLAGHVGALTLQFAAQPLGGARNLQFRYRLDGVDADWVASEHADVRYPRLPPGDYRFELQAWDPQRQLASAPVRLAFAVPAWWWQRPWAQAGLALLALAALALVVRGLVGWRTRRLLRQQQHLQRLIDDRTQELKRDKQALIAARESLRILAARDGLTGLLNRSAIFERMQRELETSRAQKRPMAVVLIDIDHFKAINDSHGHPAGDEVLRETASRLAGAVRASDGVGRYGGEEFLVVLGDFRPDNDERLQRLLSAVHGRPVHVDGRPLRITCSAGAAWTLDGGEDAAALIARADRALYAAKHAGRDRLEIAPQEGSTERRAARV